MVTVTAASKSKPSKGKLSLAPTPQRVPPFPPCFILGVDFLVSHDVSCCCVVLAAASKGKYVALAVLLPRVGAVQMLEMCPSFVEQLVWAVGVRGNVSGQAVSLLLQFLKAMTTEVRRGVVESKNDR